MNHSAHSYSGLSIPDKVKGHDLDKVPLTTQPSDDNANLITEYVLYYNSNIYRRCFQRANLIIL